MPDIVAVYGTLRYGGSANGLMEGCKYLGRGVLTGSLYNLGPFPGYKEKTSGYVIVDLYRLPSSGGKLESLDKYEGYFPSDPKQSLYTRIAVTAHDKGDAAVEVWAYEYNNEVNEEWLIKSGDWLMETDSDEP